MKYLISLFTLTLSLSTFAVYEIDNRVDFYKIQDPKVQELAKAMSFQIYFDELKGWTFNRYWQILIKPLTDEGICANERFADQPVMRNDCSGILIGPKQMLLPGNCITDHYCKNDLYYFMFSYHLASSTPLDVMRSKKYFYKCEKLLKRAWDPESAASYAIIELDKVVEGVTPVKLAAHDDIDMKDELIAMGHPEGMPLKVAADAYVADQNKTHFTVSSDIAGSSKGAGIFNATTYELEGMLIGGTKNFVNSSDGCKRAPVLPFSETRELAIKIKGIKFPVTTKSF
jgi:hypothetical protein